VDVATLTGACVTALGKVTSGLFGTPPEWVEIVRRVAERAGTGAGRCRSSTSIAISCAARLPTRRIPEGSPRVRSQRPWCPAGVHGRTSVGAPLDIAGTAWNDEIRPYLPKGPSGVAVRTVAELAFTSEVWPAAG